MLRITGLLLAIVCCTAPGAALASDAIRERIERLMFSGSLSIDGVELIAGNVLTELYSERGFEPLWPTAEKISELEDLADLAHAEGLDPADYPLETLRALRALREPRSAFQAAELDILATETLVRIGYQLRYGKVDPTGVFSSWNFKRSLRAGADRERTLTELIEGDGLVAGAQRLLPRGPLYKRLVQALARYREIAARGAWATVPAGPVLRVGDVDTRVARLRHRLAAEGEQLGATEEPNRFDEALEEALLEFQRRHGLDSDGVVGPRTTKAMNVPVAHRINQLRASLERARWVMDEREATAGRYVLVNLASAELALVENGAPLFLTRVQVGRPYRQTPVFRGDIRYLVFNPTWTVPPGILRRDTLPRLLVEREAYLDEKHMDLLDRDGNRVDPADVAWESLGPGRFPYMVRQRPGPWNALGMVKFIFPNSHFVFLHDTPSREYFDRVERALSSGCIRVEKPFELAELVMNESRWDQAAFRDVLATERERTVHLQNTLPVFLMYWTGMADRDGTVRFFEDIYGRDARLLEAMAQAPGITMREER